MVRKYTIDITVHCSFCNFRLYSERKLLETVLSKCDTVWKLFEIIIAIIFPKSDNIWKFILPINISRDDIYLKYRK